MIRVYAPNLMIMTVYATIATDIFCVSRPWLSLSERLLNTINTDYRAFIPLCSIYHSQLVSDIRLMLLCYRHHPHLMSIPGIS